MDNPDDDDDFGESEFSTLFPMGSFLTSQQKLPPQNVVRESIFLITMNSNASPGANATLSEATAVHEQYNPPLRAAAKKLKFAIKRNEPPGLLKKGKSKKHDNTDFEGQIISVKNKYAPEFGGKFFKYHTHGLIKIKHTGRLQLDYPMIRQILKDSFQEVLGDERRDLYVNIKFVKTGENAEFYVGKDENREIITQDVDRINGFDEMVQKFMNFKPPSS